MDFSREQLLEEAKRRRLTVPYSKEDLMAEAKRRGLKTPDTQGFGGVLEDIKTGLSKIPESIEGLIQSGPSEALGVYEQMLDPRNAIRRGQNIIGGIAEAGRGVANAPSNIRNYLEAKGFINPETAKFLKDFRSPLDNENIPELLGRRGEKPGDITLQKSAQMLPYLAPGGGIPGEIAGLTTHAIGQNENPVTNVGTALLARGIGRGTQVAGNIIPNLANIPENVAARYFSSNITPVEMARNLEATGEIPTSLGRIMQSPSLTKLQENILNEVPMGGGQERLSNTARGITERGQEIIQNLSHGRPLNNANESIHQILIDAKNSQNRIKNELFEPVNRIAREEGFNLDLPRSTRLVNENLQAIQESPLYRNNSKFRRLLNNLTGVTQTSENINTGIVDASGRPIIRTENRATIAEARTIADDLYHTAERMLSNPNAIDQAQGKLYRRIANSIRNEVNHQISNNGSQNLINADRIAMENYRRNYTPFLERDIHKMVNTGDLSENFIREVIRPGKQADKASRIRRVQDLLPANDRELIGQAYLSEAIDAEGNLNPRDLVKKWNSLGPRQKQALFSQETITNMNNFERLVRLNPEALNSMYNPKTGARNLSYLANVVAPLVGGSFGGFAGAGIGLASQAILARALNRIMHNPDFARRVIDRAGQRQNILGEQ